MRVALVKASEDLKFSSVEAPTVEFLTAARSALKQAGWEAGKVRPQSAMAEQEFIKDGNHVVLSWWHGTGRYSNGKAILSLYAGVRHKHKTTEEFRVLANPSVDYVRGMAVFPNAAAKNDYLKKLKDGLAWVKSKAGKR